jgi:hypothetical protein
LRNKNPDKLRIVSCGFFDMKFELAIAEVAQWPTDASSPQARFRTRCTSVALVLGMKISKNPDATA